jgi:PEP-CTERM motif-containing protein
MRKVFMILATVVLLGGASAAFADGGKVNYTATSSAEGESFTFTFSEPGTISSLTTTTTVDLSEGTLNVVLPGSEVQFFDLGESGLFNIDFDLGGNSYIVEFFGPQIYSGSSSPFKLLTGTFPVTGGYIILDGEDEVALSGGSVTAVGTPEPASLAMLGFGLAAIGALRRKARVA